MPSICGMVCTPACTLWQALQHFWGRVQCEVTLLKPSQICQTQTISGIDGDSIYIVSVVDFWMGGVDQRIFGLSTAAPLGKSKRSAPHRGFVSVWAV